MLRKLLMRGLKKKSSSKQAYWSKYKRRLPALSRAVASAWSRSRNGRRILKYFSPCRPSAWTGVGTLAAIGRLRNLTVTVAGFQAPETNTADSVPNREKNRKKHPTAKARIVPNSIGLDLVI